MKVAFITEGVSEFKSLPSLYAQLRLLSGNVFLSPLKVNVSPDAPPRVIARECRSRLLIAQAKGADLAVILLDREAQEACSGLIADQIESAATRLCSTVKLRVVLKDRMFENWLIADLNALRAQPQRFEVSNATVRRVQPNKADRCDAQRILAHCTKGDRYDKVRDSQAICANIDIEVAARHSRSVRHLLHVLGAPVYSSQCRDPVPTTSRRSSLVTRPPRRNRI